MRTCISWATKYWYGARATVAHVFRQSLTDWVVVLKSMEIIAKKGAKWTLRFVTDAVCYMEVPNDILSVLRERRKHVNGNIFTFVYSVKSIAK